MLAQPSTKQVLVEGRGQTLVMLHGGTADMSVFTEHAKLLAPDYLVVRMQQFNVQYAAEGRKLPRHYSVRMESDGVKATLDSLRLTAPAILVGHSYGGLIALDFALQHPDAIAALVLIEPPVLSLLAGENPPPAGTKPMRKLLSKLLPHARITDQRVEAFRCLLMDCHTTDIRQHPQWPNWIRHKNRLRGLAVINRYRVSPEALAQFAKPVLIITGTQTVAFHQRINEQLAAAFPRAHTASLPGSHTAVNSHAADFVGQVRAFLAVIAGPTTH